MATTTHAAVVRLARAAFARSLEWENQPAGRRLVARPAGTSRTIVAARGTSRWCSSVSRVTRRRSRISFREKDKENPARPLAIGNPFVKIRRDVGRRVAHVRPSKYERPDGDPSAGFWACDASRSIGSIDLASLTGVRGVKVPEEDRKEERGIEREIEKREKRKRDRADLGNLAPGGLYESFRK